MADKYLNILAKLLKQAENASTEEEASVYMSKAQDLSTRYEIDLALARMHTDKQETREVPAQETFLIGKKRGRGLTIKVALMTSLAQNNNVKINIAHDSTYVVLFGFPSQIETIQALYGSLTVQLAEAGRKFIASGEWNTGEERYDYNTGCYKKPHALSERLSFEEGWVSRISSRLRQARSATMADIAVQELDAAPSVDSVPAGAQVALRAAELEVREFYTKHSHTRGHYRGATKHSGSSSSYTAGHAAGGNARMGAQKQLA